MAASEGLLVRLRHVAESVDAWLEGLEHTRTQRGGTVLNRTRNVDPKVLPQRLPRPVRSVARTFRI